MPDSHRKPILSDPVFEPAISISTAPDQQENPLAPVTDQGPIEPAESQSTKVELHDVPALEPAVHFDIHASVVFQLGESLITDVIQALVELIKNSYDADATFCNVIINTSDHPVGSLAYSGARGYVSIEDNGQGMDLETIRRGWLTISNSLKRETKRRAEVTERGRTPLGDKGLGRLGVQRLGENVEIVTCRAGHDEYSVWFSWHDFRGEATLATVPIGLKVVGASRPPGTRLTVSDLKDAASWDDATSVEDLQVRLSQMISPYRQVRDFLVGVTLNGQSLELAEITEQVRQAANLRYHLSYEDQRLCITGKARLSYFQSSTRAERSDRDLFRRLVEKDGGDALFEYLSNQKLSSDIHLRRSEEAGWFVEFSYSPALHDVNPAAVVDGKLADPGNFTAEIDSFDLGDTPDDIPGVLDGVSEFRKYVKTLSGVRVYRDGFGIRVDDDWLGLGKQWTTASSYYVLKPGNTMGYVALSAKHNAKLEETTNREGFSDTPHYRNFRGLLQLFVQFTMRAQGLLRRGYVAFRNSHQEKVAATTPDTATEEILGEVSRRLANAASSRVGMQRVRQDLLVASEQAQVSIRAAIGATGGAHPQVRALQEAADHLQRAMAAAEPVLAAAQAALDQLESLDAKVRVLLDREAVQREQALQMYEMIGVGLTAEALSHEIRNITDRVSHRSQSFRQRLKDGAATSRETLAYVEHVVGSITSLRRQLAHLEPSLRYTRERRERIPLENFLTQTADYYRARIGSASIDVCVTKLDDFAVRTNPGKLVQVFDNLALNSEYWVKEDLRTGRLEKGEVVFEIAKPFVRVWDNGRGIDPAVEASLFEPFVTTKGRGLGRGLGLFVVRQFLDSEGCSISLLQDKNRDNRRFKFEIDFSGALDDASGS